MDKLNARTMKSTLLIVGIAVGMSTNVALAQHENMPSGDHAIQEKSKTPIDVTPDLKKDLADMYQKMADCLRTDKSLDQCSQDAMKNCPVVQKTGHCPINEGTGPMMGKRMKHGMGHMGMDNHSPNGGEHQSTASPK